MNKIGKYYEQINCKNGINDYDKRNPRMDCAECRAYVVTALSASYEAELELAPQFELAS